MVKENLRRNLVIHKLWEDGRTIDEITLETGVPRSTVGYYVRKFNRRASRGEPIAYAPANEKPNEQSMAVLAFAKVLASQRLFEMLGEEDGLDKVYKLLMIAKLVKELQREIFVTEDERKAFLDNIGHVIEQIAQANKSAST